MERVFILVVVLYYTKQTEYLLPYRLSTGYPTDHNVVIHMKIIYLDAQSKQADFRLSYKMHFELNNWFDM